MCKINIKATSRTSLFPVFCPGTLILCKLSDPLVSFHFVVSFDSNIAGLTTLPGCQMLGLYTKSFFMHFHLSVVNGELAVLQFVIDLGSVSRPFLGYVAVCWCSRIWTWGGFLKEGQGLDTSIRTMYLASHSPRKHLAFVHYVVLRIEK